MGEQAKETKLVNGGPRVNICNQNLELISMFAIERLLLVNHPWPMSAITICVKIVQNTSLETTSLQRFIGSVHLGVSSRDITLYNITTCGYLLIIMSVGRGVRQSRSREFPSQVIQRFRGGVMLWGLLAHYRAMTHVFAMYKSSL